MDKITFGSIVVETTRRCNMRCRHCLRGEPQNKDIDLAYIDALLNQADIIDSVVFTGGEPTLNLDAMEHMAAGLINRGVLLFNFQVLTNGVEYSERLVEVAKRFREIIDICCEAGFAKGTYDSKQEASRVIIGVSLDKYHSDSEKCEKNYQLYKMELEGIADVVKAVNGNTPVRMGRAVSLRNATPIEEYTISTYKKQSIEVLDKTHTPVCKLHNNFKLIDSDQRIVCCTLVLGIDGFIRSGTCTSSSYEIIDSFPKVCNVSDSIWDGILAYNKGRVNCSQIERERMKTILRESSLGWG